MSNNQLTILLYHGVTDYQSSGIENNSGKHISKQEFEREMRYIKSNCNVLSMNEVVSLFQTQKTLPRNSVAVTFDDGFENNYTIAAPILEEVGVPATFYITSGIIGTDKMFWVDQLEFCIDLTTKKELDVCLGGKKHVFELQNDKAKIFALNTIKSYCKNVHKSVKDKVLESVILGTNLGPNPKISPNYRVLTWDQVRKMSKNPLFSIGGHNITHDTLSRLSFSEMSSQIQGSLEAIKEKINTDVVHYSYPEGQAEHFNSDTIDILKNNGIKCCPTAINGVNSLQDDLFYLKRVMVGMAGIKFPYRELRK